MIGYEFEFLVRKGDTLMPREDFVSLHIELHSRGWKPKYDACRNGLLGSTKDGFYVGIDDIVSIMEINAPPRDTIHDCHEDMKILLTELQGIYESLGCYIIGASFFPGNFAIESCTGTTECDHPLVTEKGFVRYISLRRQGKKHHADFVMAAHQVWLDVAPEKVVSQMSIITRLSPALIALFANGPIINNKKLDVLEGRDSYWLNFFTESPHYEYDKNIYGMMEKPFDSLIEYFDHVFASPFFFSDRDEKAFSLADTSITHGEYLHKDSVEAVAFDEAYFTVTPSITDFRWSQNCTFPYARFKFSLRDDVTLPEILSAYDARDENTFLACFNKTHIECRVMSGQPQTDISAGPAFLLGLQQKFDEVDAILSLKSYDFWKSFYKVALKDGLTAKHEGMYMKELLQTLLGLAREGLIARGLHEEKYLEPLIKRIETEENPAQEMLRIWEKGGLDAVFRARDYQ